MVLITICARAGSKGLPNKHLLPFNGKPLIQWTFDLVKDFVENVLPTYGIDCAYVVSTDDEKIIKQIGEYAMPYRLRSPELCKDDTPKLDVLRDILKMGWPVVPSVAFIPYMCPGDEPCHDCIDKECKNYPNGLYLKHFDTIIDLDATNPCRTVEHIKGALDLFRESNADVVFSVTPAKKNPYFNQIENGSICKKIVAWVDGEAFIGRQYAPEVFDMNSSIYVYKAEWLKNPKNLHPVCENSRAYIMPSWTFCDIDDEKDFIASEALHRRYCLNEVVETT